MLTLPRLTKFRRRNAATTSDGSISPSVASVTASPSGTAASANGPVRPNGTASAEDAPSAVPSSAEGSTDDAVAADVAVDSTVSDAAVSDAADVDAAVTDDVVAEGVDSKNDADSTSAADAPAAPPKKPRLAWPDVARAISILGVISFHVELLLIYFMDTDTWFAEMNAYLTPFRMPLFFMISGYFSTKIARYNLWQLFTKRLWYLLIPYFFWSPLEKLVFREVRVHFEGWDRFNKGEVYEEVIHGHGTLWFLYALAIFTCVYWVMAKLRIPAPVAILIGILLGPWWYVHYEGEITDRLYYVTFFIFGAYARRLLTRWAEMCTTWWGFLLGACLTGLSIYLTWLGRETDHIREAILALESHYNMVEDTAKHTVWMGGCFVAIFAGIWACVWIAKIPGISRLSRWIGQHTLELYVSHDTAIQLVFYCVIIQNAFNLAVIENWDIASTVTRAYLVAMAAGVTGGLIVALLAKIPVLGWVVKPFKLPERSPLGWTIDRIRHRKNSHA